jgi:hypothetical protein
MKTRRKPEPRRPYRCRGGPFDGQQIVLSGNGSILVPVSTFTFRVGDQVGRYVGTGAAVTWQEG